MMQWPKPGDSSLRGSAIHRSYSKDREVATSSLGHADDREENWEPPIPSFDSSSVRDVMLEYDVHNFYCPW